MNNLKIIMEKKGATTKQLATLTGIAPSNIRRLYNDPQATPYHSTAEKLAKALDVTVAQICGQDAPLVGDREILRQRVADAVREILGALRDYSSDTAHLHLAIFTNEGDGMDDLADYWVTVDGEEVLKVQRWEPQISKGTK